MSTPKPGQIRCPTCLRSTPPAAFCTQCGSPIPQSSMTRPRGLDRDELEERVRRRPGEGFRRGSGSEAAPGYAPFAPEPEDSLAPRQKPEAAARRVDNLRADDASEPQPGWRSSPPEEAWPAEDREDVAAASQPYVEPEYDYPAEAYDDTPYGRPEDAYAYPYQADDGRRGGGGGGALPIIGFVALCVLALAVGAVLAGLLGTGEQSADTSPSASAEASVEQSAEASPPPSGEASASAGEATPEPTDGPITFPDGGVLTIQPCATNEWREEAIGRPEEMACQVDGTTDDDGDVTAIIVFNSVSGSDTLRVQLRSNGETVNQQEHVLSSVLSCGEGCNGLIYGARYQALEPGDYELVLERNGEFADSATFAVEG